MDDFLSQFNCPQYVDFMTEDKCNVTKNLGASPSGSSVKELSGLGVSPTCSSVKDDNEFENMDTGDRNSYYLEDKKSYPATLTESCLQLPGYNSYQDSMKSISSASCQAVDFPVHHPKNISSKENKPNSRDNKTGKAQTFHFMESLKRKHEDEHIPLAEQVIAFQKKTPQRFHTTNSKKFEPLEHWSPSVTNPKSPNLKAVKRMRGVNVLSREEQEQKEAEEMKGYRFHARPLHRSILRPYQPANGNRKTPTKPQSFHLKTAQRAAEIQARRKIDEKPYEFHARPIPKAILNGPTGIKEKLSLPVTEAKTPNFVLKSRAERWKSENKSVNINNSSDIIKNQRFKALPAPAPIAPFVPKLEKKLTEIQPFSFDSKDKERIAKKEEKIMKEIEKENKLFIFKAQAMPSPTPSSLPAVENKSRTIPQPFNFHSDGINSKHSDNSSVEQVCPVFKAQPATVLEKPPFIPLKSAKQPVEVEEFHFHTDIRASEREKLKEMYDIKQREKERALQELKRLQEEEERREIEKLRKEIVHKANPIRHYKAVEIKPSNKGLTMPISPKFKTDERLQKR